MHPNSVPQEKSWLDTELCQRELLRGIPVAIYTCDERGIITYFNDAAADMWGRKPVIGQDSWCGSWRIYKPDGSPVLLDECPMAITIRDGFPVRGHEVIILRPDGTRSYVMPYPAPIRNGSGSVVGAVNTIMDLSKSEVGQSILQAFVVRKNPNSTQRTAPNAPSATASPAAS